MTIMQKKMNRTHSRVHKLVNKALTEYNMLSENDKVLVGFSGGSDSVCLLTVLYELGYDVMAAHLNHNMRDTALRDMLFCEKYCSDRKIPFVSKTVNKGTLKNEADARTARYDFFREVMQEYNLNKLATAHNKNDSAETVLLHMLRGASLDGLCGIAPIDGDIIRPLIFVKKSEVNAYCCESNLSYVTDETNLENVYTRNKLRNVIIPQLEEEFNGKLVDTISDNALLMSYDREFLYEYANKAYQKLERENGIDISGLKELNRAISSRVIELFWQRAVNDGNNLSGKYIEKIIELIYSDEGGKSIDLPDRMTARNEYGVLSVQKKSEEIKFEREIEIGKWCICPEIDSKIGLFPEGKGLKISLNGTEKLFVRTRINGDSFRPSGLGGRKTVSDYFTDIKLPRIERDRVPVLIADDSIVCLGTMRCDEDFAPGKRNNEYVLMIENND